MPYVKCVNCNNQISDKAIKCPYCDMKLKRTIDIAGVYKKLAVATAVGLVVAVLVFVDGTMTRTSVTKDTFEAGTEVDFLDYIKADNDKAEVRLLGRLDTDTLGEQEIPYEISFGLLRHKRKVKVNVVDTVAPVIVGPSSLTIIKGEEFSVNDYYQVEDFETDLGDYLIPNPSIAYLRAGFFEVTLSVEDSSGNHTEKVIDVEVINVTDNERKVLDCINAYLEEGHDTSEIGKKAYLYIADDLGQEGDYTEYLVMLGNGELFLKFHNGKLYHIESENYEQEYIDLLTIFAREYGEKISYAKFFPQGI